MSRYGRAGKPENREERLSPPNQWHVVTLTYDGLHSRLYLDGEMVHEKTWGSTKGLAHPPDPDMFIGRCPGGVQFNGYIDDLTLWNKSLSQGEIRALNYLDRGLNGIVVPRGLFFQSQFFSNLNTTTFSPSSPIVGSTAIGNSNPLELHAKTIQQLIAANLTLAAAWTWIQELMTANDTGNITSFPLVVTGEIYTLGFDGMVLNVLPNMTVENSGNSTVPPPPIREPTFWEAAWNSFTGMLEAAWNAVVAVATFIANVALAVIKWCIDFAVAIAEGRGLQFFYDTVVKPFVDAVMAFVKWIIDIIVGAFKWILSGFTAAIGIGITFFMEELVFNIHRHWDPSPLDVAAAVAASLILGSGIVLLIAAFAGVFEILENSVLLPFKPFLQILRPIVLVLATVIMAAILVLSIPVQLQDNPQECTDGLSLVSQVIPDQAQYLMQLPYSFAALWLTMAALAKPGELPYVKTAMGLAFATVGLFLDMYTVNGPARICFVVDMFALFMGILAAEEIATDPAGGMVPLTSIVGFVIAMAVLALSANNLAQDFVDMNGGG